MTFMLQKVSDEGTSDPFYARLWFGVFQLRDTTLQIGKTQDEFEKARQSFDQLYKPVLEATSAARTSAKEVQRLISDHRAKLSQGTILRLQSNTFELSESIGKPLRDKIADFLVNGVIALKSIQAVVKPFDVDIGCLYQKPNKFEQGIADLRASRHPSLAEYLVNAREVWTEQFIERRNSLEHEGWTLPRVEYIFGATNSAEMIEPQIDGLSISSYCATMLNRVMGFMENIIVYTFRYVLKTSMRPLAIVEIPTSQREHSNPQRFRIDIKNPAIVEWDIKFSETDFV